MQSANIKICMIAYHISFTVYKAPCWVLCVKPGWIVHISTLQLLILVWETDQWKNISNIHQKREHCYNGNTVYDGNMHEYKTKSYQELHGWDKIWIGPKGKGFQRYRSRKGILGSKNDLNENIKTEKETLCRETIIDLLCFEDVFYRNMVQDKMHNFVENSKCLAVKFWFCKKGALWNNIRQWYIVFFFLFSFPHSIHKKTPKNKKQ